MPHHSKYSQQQRKQVDTSIANSPGGYRQQQLYQSASTSMDEDLKRTNHALPHWMKQSSSSDDNMDRAYHRGRYHRVPSSPPEAISSGTRTLQSRSKDDHDAFKQTSRDPSQEIASVLLLVAAAATSDTDLTLSSNRNTETARDIDVVDSYGNRPLKKRKGMDHDVVVEVSGERKNPDDACHVSPISHSSKSRDTMESNVIGHDTPSTSSSHSLDDPISTTNAEATQSRAAHMRPKQSMYQMIPQFPLVLHWILSESLTQPPSKDFTVDFSVLQWVAHGQAWRIIRWDSFHRDVLPAIFPQLSYGVNSLGSVDAFMWQMKAWGFQEIKDGPDIGAFAHTLFRRGHPKMCEEMKFIPTEEDISSSLGSASRSILRVPSLNLTTPSPSRPLTVEDRSDRSLNGPVSIVDYTGSPLHHQTPTSHSTNTSTFLRGQSQELPSYVKYRPEEMNRTPDGNWQLATKFNVQGSWTGVKRMMNTAQVGEIGNTTYSPMGIRSSRGGRRHSLGSSRTPSNPVSVPNSTPSTESDLPSSRGFPVSNRGMGRRSIAAAATMTKTVAPSVYTNDEVVMLAGLKSSSPANTVELPVQDVEAETKAPRSVLKRKLPLMLPSGENDSKVE